MPQSNEFDTKIIVYPNPGPHHSSLAKLAHGQPVQHSRNPLILLLHGMMQNGCRITRHPDDTRVAYAIHSHGLDYNALGQLYQITKTNPSVAKDHPPLDTVTVAQLDGQPVNVIYSRGQHVKPS